MQRTNSPVTTEFELCLESWSAGPSLADDGVAVYHALAATTLLVPPDPSPTSKDMREEPPAETDEGASASGARSVYDSAMTLLINLLRAERSFLFAVATEPDERRPVEIGKPLSALDRDGMDVAQPERRVPLPALREAVSSSRPVLAPAEGSSVVPGTAFSGPVSSGPVHALTLPIAAAGRPNAVLHIENRFQPLDLNRDTLRLAKAYCLVLGSLVEGDKLRELNEALWHDLSRLRSEHTVVAAASVAGGARQIRGSRRSDLKGDYSLIIGESPRMLEVFRVIDRISTSNAPVLINGESGTGKELIANAVHANSPRTGKAFVSENCGALTETLLESELFGYVKGAFTGANKDHKGLFELAVGGTLFLDEVGDMSPGMQKKLLRVLQEGVIRRVGGKDYISVDVRIISATNKDLLDEVRAGNFREDLYYRLNVINLRLPPLRERKEDIPLLVESFLEELVREGESPKKIEPAALERLSQHGWPGNIRELRNEMKRLVALADGDVRVSDLSESVVAGEGRDLPFHALQRELGSLTLRDATERLEKEMIRHAMIHCRGNKSLMAKMLEVPKTSLYNKINKYGLDKA